MPNVPLPEIAEQAIDWIRRRDPGARAEIYLRRDRERGIDLRDGRPDNIQEANEEGMGLRLLKDGRMAFAYAGGLELGGLEALYGRTAVQLAHLPPDEHRVLPFPEEEPAAAGGLAGSLLDRSMFEAPLGELMPRLLDLHDRAKASDKRIKKILQLGYGEDLSETALASTTGVRAQALETYGSFGLSVMAEASGEVQVGGSSRMARSRSELDFDATAAEGVFRTVALLDAKKLPARRCSVLFDPWVAGELLDLLAGAMSAETIQRGKSLLKGKLGARVASDLVTFIDDPLRPAGISSGSRDDEGVPTRTKMMVDRGVLKEIFYDTYTAHKDSTSSNGCAGRAGFKGMPGASSSNFFMKPGLLSRDQLLKDTRDGILVFEIMGMHTADPISGEMSVGVSGMAVRDGELAHGVRGAMLSASMLDMLQAVDAVADDLRFYGSLATPTFRVADLSVA